MIRYSIRIHYRTGASTSLACLFLLMATCTLPRVHAAGLGRLFYTPEQRAQIEYAYSRNAPAESGSSPVVTVNGIVQRHGGPRTVWINGTQRKAGNSDDQNPDAIPVSIPGKSKPVRIKVGQKISTDLPNTDILQNQ